MLLCKSLPTFFGKSLLLIPHFLSTTLKGSHTFGIDPAQQGVPRKGPGNPTVEDDGNGFLQQFPGHPPLRGKLVGQLLPYQQWRKITEVEPGKLQCSYPRGGKHALLP